MSAVHEEIVVDLKAVDFGEELSVVVGLEPVQYHKGSITILTLVQQQRPFNLGSLLRRVHHY